MSKKYSEYILDHCDNVKKAYKWLVEHKIIKDKFIHRIQTHDISKYGEEEYDAYDKYFYSNQTAEVKEAFNVAWLHHIHQNPHHWQHWVLINDEDGTKALEMSEEYVVEMICDWWSFSHKSGNLEEIFDWYKSHKSNMIMHKNTKAMVEDILDKIKKELKNDTQKNA